MIHKYNKIVTPEQSNSLHVSNTLHGIDTGKEKFTIEKIQGWANSILIMAGYILRNRKGLTDKP